MIWQLSVVKKLASCLPFQCSFVEARIRDENRELQTSSDFFAISHRFRTCSNFYATWWRFAQIFYSIFPLACRTGAIFFSLSSKRRRVRVTCDLISSRVTRAPRSPVKRKNITSVLRGFCRLCFRHVSSIAGAYRRVVT